MQSQLNSTAERRSARFMGARHEGDQIRFGVWAPGRERIDVVLYKKDGAGVLGSLAMREVEDGWFEATFDGASRLLYKYRVDGQGPFPDPASRSQPFGVHGPSEIAEDHVGWTDGAWKGIALDDAVLYEVHVGTATEEGTFQSLALRLPELKALGVNTIELMPVGSFPGRRNWGYDGVSLYAPQASYGGGFGLKRLVDAAHRLGLAVVLDVVYNHLGPDGNYLRCFTPDWFTDRKVTPWGDALDLGNPNVRAFFTGNAEMWIRDYHLDGLRLDATHTLLDSDDDPSAGSGRGAFLRELAEKARAAGGGRRVIVMAEDERNERRLVLSHLKERGGSGLDAVWADDFHHQVRRAIAGDHEGYYRDYTGTAADLVTTLRQGWFYQGQQSEHLGAPRGTKAAGIEPARFIHCIQNHDQVGNRAFGDRLCESASPAAYRAASALLLLSPYTPLLFMGQEWGASTPFLYFTDFDEELGRAVRDGRCAEFQSFADFAGKAIPDPQSPSTFARSMLRWEERREPDHAGVLALYQELLALRSNHLAMRVRTREHFEVAQVGDSGVVLKRRGLGASELLLVVNLGGSLRFTPQGAYRLVLYSNEARFGGDEAGPGFVEGEVRIEGAGAVVLETAR